MRGLLLAAAMAGALLAPSAAAQTAGVPLRVQTGEVYTVAIEQTQTTDMGSGQNVEATLRHSYTLQIVDAERSIWRYTPASLTYELPTGLGLEQQAAYFDWPALSEAMSAMMRIGADIGFECRVDEYGRCIEMTNWPMWRDRLENVVLMADAFVRMVPSSGSTAGAEVPAIEPDSGRKSDETSDVGETGYGDEVASPPFDWVTYRLPILRGFAASLDNFDARDAASSMAFLDAPGLLQGRSLTRRQSVPVSTELEMPFGAPPLRYTGTMRLDRINQSDNSATIVRQVSLDEDSARAATQGILQFFDTNFIQPIAAIGGQAGDAASVAAMIEPMIDTLGMRYEETTTGTVDLTTGMARETVTEYTFTILPPGGEGDGVPIALRGRTVIRITPGAPDIPRLPRQ